MDELLEQFLIEGPELVEQAGADLLALEQKPGDAALIDSAFRAVHTLKGSVGLFDLAPMAVVLHRAEDLLDDLRQGRLKTTRPLVDALLSVVDRCGVWLESLAGDGALSGSAGDESRHLISVLDLCRGAAASAASTTSPESVAWADDLQRRHDKAGAASAVRYRPDPQAYFRGDDPLDIARATPGLLSLNVIVAGATAGDDYDPFVCALTFEILSSAAASELAPAFRFVKDQVEIESLEKDGRPAGTDDHVVPATSTTTSLRIDGRRIDALADLADELVIAKNALLSHPTPDSALMAAQAAIDRLTTALHSDIMRLRLVPLSPVLRRLERQARDLAASLGKAVDLTVRGHDVEADKALVDALYEPLLHLVRNALDHGLETAADRLVTGKAERARLSVTAHVIGDEIEVEVRDDGRGMDPDRLRAAARERGMGADVDLEALTDQASLELIFAPGFSTAGVVSAVSGRGVGMDAVRTSVSALGGRVSLASRISEGSTFTLRLPLTVVMTPVLMVECGGESFGLPLAAVRETLRIHAADVRPIRLGRAIVLRDAVLPYLALSNAVTDHTDSATNVGSTALVVDTSAGRVALGVDRITGRRDVVMKPMSGLLSRVPGAVGTTLLGDGRVLLILDVEALVR